MGIHRLNHAVLYVRNTERSLSFYRDALGFDVVTEVPDGRGAFLRAPASTNDHDLAIFALGDELADSPAGRSAVGLYHLAWEVETLGELAEMRERLRAGGFLVGQSDHGTTKSLYAKDPDGIESEIVWLIPAADLTDDDRGSFGTRPLDLEAELARFGPDARSGLGISRPTNA